MRVEIDSHSGFCFGVVRAISRAEEALQEQGEVFSLGDIVHNRVEVRWPRAARHAHGDPRSDAGTERAESLHPGAWRTSFDLPAGGRAGHRADRRDLSGRGQTPAARRRGARKDAAGRRTGSNTRQAGTCRSDRAHRAGRSPTLVVETEEDLDQIDFTRPIYFLSQTTQSISLFQHLCDRMRSRATDPAQVFAHDTICRQVSNRESHLEEFAGRFDVIIFVCGRKSSNGRVLFEVCRRANPRSYNVEEVLELRPEWFEGAESVGICGATSTPSG